MKGVAVNELAMAPIYPVTALSKDIKAVKAKADKQVVRISENGRGAYVFASEKALADLIEKERQDAAWEAYTLQSVARGVADVDAGRYTTSREAMFQKASEYRMSNHA